MEEQLALIRDESHDWRLDEQTRRLGIEGVQRARSALRRSENGQQTGRQNGGARPGPASPTTRAA